MRDKLFAPSVSMGAGLSSLSTCEGQARTSEKPPRKTRCFVEEGTSPGCDRSENCRGIPDEWPRVVAGCAVPCLHAKASLNFRKTSRKTNRVVEEGGASPSAI